MRMRDRREGEENLDGELLGGVPVDAPSYHRERSLPYDLVHLCISESFKVY